MRKLILLPDRTNLFLNKIMEEANNYVCLESDPTMRRKNKVTARWNHKKVVVFAPVDKEQEGHTIHSHWKIWREE